jgi:hypothetical protein
MLNGLLNRLGWLDSPTGRKLRVLLGILIEVAVLINWPLSMFTYAATEPPVVLSLSWAALAIEGLTLITASQAFEEQGRK